MGLRKSIQSIRLKAWNRWQRARHDKIAQAYRSGDRDALMQTVRRMFPEGADAVEDYLTQHDGHIGNPLHVFLAARPVMGRVQSYHHFLGALLYPLILHAEAFGFADGTVLHVVDCGSHNRHVETIAQHYGLSVVFVPAEIEQAVRRNTPDQVLDLYPFDAGNFRDRWFSQAELAHLADFAARLIPESNAPSGVLLISRGESDPAWATDRFKRMHSTPRAEAATGKARRFIPNEPELIAALEAVSTVTLATLENASLADQIRLFREAKVVIGQHGAGLNGMLWSAPGTQILEILPVDKLGPSSTHFRAMAGALGHEYRVIMQSGAETPVDVDAIARWVRGTS